MKYAIIKVTNGAFDIVSEWDSLERAIVAYHDVCKIQWNAQDVEHATVMIADERLNIVQGFIEYIKYN